MNVCSLQYSLVRNPFIPLQNIQSILVNLIWPSLGWCIHLIILWIYHCIPDAAIYILWMAELFNRFAYTWQLSFSQTQICISCYQLTKQLVFHTWSQLLYTTCFDWISWGHFTNKDWLHSSHHGWIITYIIKCVIKLLVISQIYFNSCTIVEVWEWISNLIPHITGHLITYPCWDYS